MLSFFKVNDPFRLIGVVLYLVLIAFVMLTFFPFPTTEPNLIWMVLGERLSQGFFLYQDVLDDTGPLSAGVFTVIHFLFGRSELVFDILGRMLIFFQIVYWNNTLMRYRVFDENTYLPAIIMAALYHFSFDMTTLSPTLIGSTFLMLALGQLFSQTVLQKETSESTLLIGLYGGLATGFHLNFVLFLPYIIFTGLAVSGFSIRQLFLSLVGFFLPILLILVFYFWNNGLKEALQFWPLIFTYEKYHYQPFLSWLIPGILPVLLALAGYFFGSFFRGATINQQKQRQLIVLWLLFSGLFFFLVKRQAAYQLLVFIPGLTYLITQFFLHFRSGIIAPLAFALLLIGLPFGGLAYWHNRLETDQDYFVKPPESDPLPKNKTVMVLGKESNFYLDHPLGGPFLNYQLAKTFLTGEKSLEQKAQLFRKLSTQQADFIIDEEGVFQGILEEIPALKEYYKQKEPGMFVKIDKQSERQ